MSKAMAGAESCCDYESTAAALLRECELAHPADPFALAWCLGLRRVHRRGIGVALVGTDVIYDWKQPLERQRALVARAIARFVLRERGHDHSEAAITSLAAEVCWWRVAC